MAQQQKPPAVGEDVTDLMPAVGEDVSALMGGADLETPSVMSTPAKNTARRVASWLPTVGGLVGGVAGGVAAGPAGAVGLAALGGAAGEGYRQTLSALTGGQVPDFQDRALGMAGQAAAQGASEALGRGVTKGATSAGKALYRGYLKPSLSAKGLPKADRIVETGIAEGLPITKAGVTKANDAIAQLNTEVDALLASSPERVDLKAVATKVRAWAKDKYFKPGADLSDYKAALAVADKIDTHPAIALPPGLAATRIKVPLKDANEVKKALQASANESYGVITTAEKTANKQAGYQMRKAIEAKAKAIAPLNARESRLIDASKAIAQAVGREENANPLKGVANVIAGGAGALSLLAGDSPQEATAKGLAVRVGLHPALATRAAILAPRIATQLGVTTAVASRLAVHALIGNED
jgi:hypothetical protein